MNYYRQSFHISHVYSLWQDLSMGTIIFDLVTLTLKFDLLFKNFNLGHSFLTRRGRAFIFNMYIPCDKVFPWVAKFLTLWPWPWRLNLLSKKNFNLGHSFLTRRGRAFIFHTYIPCDKTFPWIQKKIDLVTLTLTFDLLLENFNLGHSFLTRRGRAFIFHTFIPCDKTFPWVPTFFTLWPWHLTYF